MTDKDKVRRSEDLVYDKETLNENLRFFVFFVISSWLAFSILSDTSFINALMEVSLGKVLSVLCSTLICLGLWGINAWQQNKTGKPFFRYIILEELLGQLTKAMVWSYAVIAMIVIIDYNPGHPEIVFVTIWGWCIATWITWLERNVFKKKKKAVV